jgi:hypothetical protein
MDCVTFSLGSVTWRVGVEVRFELRRMEVAVREEIGEGRAERRSERRTANMVDKVAIYEVYGIARQWYVNVQT